MSQSDPWVSGTDVYGPLLDVQLLIDQLSATIAEWCPAYLWEVERHRSAVSGETPNAPPPFRSYVDAVDLDNFPEDQVPCCLIVVAGTADIPERRARGRYDAWWSVGVGSLVSAMDHDSTHRLARHYGVATRALILQQAHGGLIGDVQWMAESYDHLREEETRSIAMAVCEFRMLTNDVATKAGGPAVPPVDPSQPPGSYGTVRSVTIDIDAKE